MCGRAAFNVARSQTHRVVADALDVAHHEAAARQRRGGGGGADGAAAPQRGGGVQLARAHGGGPTALQAPADVQDVANSSALSEIAIVHAEEGLGGPQDPPSASDGAHEDDSQGAAYAGFVAPGVGKLVALRHVRGNADSTAGSGASSPGVPCELCTFPWSQQLVNIRGETFIDSRSATDPSARCVVVVDGYFELSDPTNVAAVQRKRAYFFRPPPVEAAEATGAPHRSVMFLAGVIRQPREGTQRSRRPMETEESIAVVTVSTSRPLQWCHHRQPLILTDSESVATWLGTTSAAQLYKIVAPAEGMDNTSNNADASATAGTPAATGAFPLSESGTALLPMTNGRAQQHTSNSIIGWHEVDRDRLLRTSSNPSVLKQPGFAAKLSEQIRPSFRLECRPNVDSAEQVPEKRTRRESVSIECSGSGKSEDPIVL